MSTLPAATRHQNMTGSSWMVASMIAFSFEDVMPKLASAVARVFQAMVVFGALGMLGLALRALATRAALRTIPNTVLSFYSFASVVVAGSACAVWENTPFRVPNALDILLLAAAFLIIASGLVVLLRTERESVELVTKTASPAPPRPKRSA